MGSLRSGAVLVWFVMTSTFLGGCERQDHPADAIRLKLQGVGKYSRLLLRSESTGSGSLLLRRLTPTEEMAIDREESLPQDAPFKEKFVYRYRPGARELEAVGLDVWDRADTSICNCGKPVSLATSNPVSVDLGHVLRSSNGVVPTAAPTALALCGSFDQRFFAVLSAEGPFRSGGIIFGGASAAGKHYHEVFLVSNLKRLGEPITLQGAGSDASIRACWSPDGRYVVYYDTYLTGIWIIPTLPEAAGKEKQ